MSPVVHCSFCVAAFTVGLCVNSGSAACQTKPSPDFDTFPTNHAADRSLLKELGYVFRPHRTPHFSIISDAKPRRVARLGETAEETLSDVGDFAARLGLADQRPSFKMSVVFFDKWADYQRHAQKAGFHVNQSVPGFFADHSNRCLVFNYGNATLIQAKRRELMVASLELRAAKRKARKQDEDTNAMIDRKRRRIREVESQIRAHERLITMTVVRHEIAHQVLSNLMLQPKEAGRLRWLREGLAMQFESRESINRHRLEDFLTSSPSAASLHLRDLVGDPKHIGPGAADLSARYARAWALVHYLIHDQPQAFGDYLRMLVRGDEEIRSVDSTVATFESTFGKLDGVFENKLLAYMRRHKASVTNEPPPNP